VRKLRQPLQRLRWVAAGLDLQCRARVRGQDALPWGAVALLEARAHPPDRTVRDRALCRQRRLRACAAAITAATAYRRHRRGRRQWSAGALALPVRLARLSRSWPRSSLAAPLSAPAAAAAAGSWVCAYLLWRRRRRQQRRWRLESQPFYAPSRAERLQPSILIPSRIVAASRRGLPTPWLAITWPALVHLQLLLYDGAAAGATASKTAGGLVRGCRGTVPVLGWR
jgi:hypothetical protein